MTPRLALVAVCTTVLVAVGTLVPVGAATPPRAVAPHTLTGAVLSIPPSTASPESAQATADACGTAASCTAVGFYAKTSAISRAVAWERTGTTWGGGRTVVLPPGLGSGAVSEFTSVSCSSKATCLLVGTYAASTSVSNKVLVVRELNGTLQPGIQLVLPSGDTSGTPYAWCASSGRCVIDGSTHTSHGERTFAASASLVAASHWLSASSLVPYATPTGLPSPHNAGSWTVTALTCVDLNDCVDVGKLQYGVAEGKTLPATQTEVAGHWGRVLVAALPTDSDPTSSPEFEFDTLSGVACSGTGAPFGTSSCVAVGSYAGTHGNELLVETLAFGAWRLGAAPPQPTDGLFYAAACETGRATCVAGGIDYNALEAGSEAGAFSVGTTSSLTSVTYAPVPRSGGEELVGLLGASCPPGTRTCVFVGAETVDAPIVPIVVTTTA